MIYEYALEPSVLSDWASDNREYSSFFREYGLGTPRIISSFPKSNSRRLRGYLLALGPQNRETLEGRRYEEIVLFLVDCIVRRGVPDAHESVWRDDVLVEHQRVPFDFILASELINTKEIITPRTMYDKSSIWNHKDQILIKRTTSSFFSVLSNFLRFSTKEFVIIDPYGWTIESIEFICFLIRSISQNRLVEDLPVLKIFYKEKNGSKNSGIGSPGSQHVKDQIINKSSGLLSNLEIEVFELKELNGGDVFHNRCIMTEHGGVITGHGISVTDDECHTDEAILMSRDIYNKKWQQFVEDNRFEIVSRA